MLEGCWKESGLGDPAVEKREEMVVIVEVKENEGGRKAERRKRGAKAGKGQSSKACKEGERFYDYGGVSGADIEFLQRRCDYRKKFHRLLCGLVKNPSDLQLLQSNEAAELKSVQRLEPLDAQISQIPPKSSRSPEIDVAVLKR